MHKDNKEKELVEIWVNYRFMKSDGRIFLIKLAAIAYLKMFFFILMGKK